MESYLQGQDLWEIVGGNETTLLDIDQALLFAIKTSIEEAM